MPLYPKIDKADIGLGNVDNTSDATKDAAVATLTNKTLTTPVINSPTGIVKGDVGLGNVDNTSDVNKPVSTATQTALDLKAPLASPTFTGTVTVPSTITSGSAVLTLPTSSGTLVSSITSQTISSNTTWTSDVFVEQGVTITVNSTFTLTINADLQAGPYPIFAGGGTVEFGTAFRGVVYPEWFGAVGNNSTDDTVAIQAAIDSLSYLGGTVQFQAKTYVTTAELTVSNGFVNIQGQTAGWLGGGGTTIRQSTGNTNILTIAGASAAAQINGNVVRDLILIHGTGAGDDTNTSGHGLKITHTVRTNVMNVIMVGTNRGLYLDHVFNGYFNNIKIHRIYDIPAGNAYGIYIADDGTNFSASNIFRDIIIAGSPTRTGSLYGVYYNGHKLNDLFFENVEVSFCEYGIYLNNTVSADLNYDIKITKPVIDNYTVNAIYLAGFNNNGGCTIMNGWFAPTAGITGTKASVRLATCRGIKVIGAEFVGTSNASNTSGYGIYATATTDSLFTNNTFREYYFHMGMDGCSRNTVAENSFQSISVAASDYILFTGTSVGNIINANTMVGAASAGATRGIFLDTNVSDTNVISNYIEPTYITTPISNVGSGNVILTQSAGVYSIPSLTSASVVTSGSLQLKYNASYALTNALNSNLAITGTQSFATFTGGGASCQLGGMTAGVDGQVRVFFNNTGNAISIIGESASSTAANRIFCQGLTTVTVANLGTRMFIYSTQQSRWLLIGGA